MRNLKPFNMIYRDWKVRVINIQNFKNNLHMNVYKFKIVLKRDNQKQIIPIEELNAEDKEDLKNRIRLILNQVNF